jgi:hypothetical protein
MCLMRKQEMCAAATHSVCLKPWQGVSYTDTVKCGDCTHHTQQPACDELNTEPELVTRQ